MDKERSLRFWKIRRENKPNRRVMGEWVRRKEFRKLTEDKNCFGIVIPGIKPEQMTDDEYMQFVEPLPKANMRL